MQAWLGTLDPDETSGDELADLLTASESALFTTHSGATRPSYVRQGMLWLDTSTTPWVLKMAGTGTTDIRVAEIDPTNVALDSLAQIAKRVRFDAGQTLSDAEKIQARSNIGAAKAAGFLKRDPILLTGSVTTITIPVNGAKRMRMTYRGRLSGQGQDTQMVVSEDGGATYITAANSYAGPRGIGAQGSGPLAFYTGNSAAMAIAGNTTDTAYEAVADLDLTIGDGTRAFRNRVRTDSFSSGGATNLYQFAGSTNAQTHLRLFLAAGTFLAGTLIEIEDFFG